MNPSKFSFKTRIFLGYSLLIVMMSILVASDLTNYAHTERNLAEIKNLYLPNALSSSTMTHHVINVQQFLTDVAATHESEGLADALAVNKDFKNELNNYRQRLAGDSVKQQEIDILENTFDQFYKDGKRMAFRFIDGDKEAAVMDMDNFDATAYRLTTQILKIRDQENNAVRKSVDEINSNAHEMRIVLLVLSAIVIIFAFIISVLLTRHLSRQIGIDPFYARGITREIAKGDLSRNIYLDSNDNKSLLHAIKMMQQELLERRESEQKTAAEILRIKNALDNITTGVMIADHERKIVYLNKSAVTALAVYEDGIREQLPMFNSQKLLNEKIDQFHVNPERQKNLLANLKTQLNTELKLGHGTMALSVNPVIDENGQHLGTVVEWRDKTAEVAVQNEVAEIVYAASQGDFSQRFNLNGKEGFLHDLALGLNKLLSTSETGLNDIAHVLAAISRGDLTEKITNHYVGTFGQLKEDTNATVEKLKMLINEIKDATDSIYTGSKEIASGNNDLSQRTETQAANLEKTATSINQFAEAVASNAANAKRANELVLNAVEIATQGGTAVKNVISTMGNINESAHRIEDIITVIDDIAFQTNILALNAAVEAARAGEQGKGFAVVAVEVRNLAQRSAVAADEIKRLIADSVSQVNGGSELVTQAGNTMNQVIEAIQGVTAMMTEINAASSAQNSDIQEVNQAINKMEMVTQQNAALVEQSAAAAESLEDQAENLSIIIQNFKC